MRQQFVFLTQFQFCFQLVCFVEVVFDTAFVTAGDEHHFGTAGFNRFFNCILNQRFVHDRQHFFWAGFGRRQETGAHTGNGKDAFFNGFHIIILF